MYNKCTAGRGRGRSRWGHDAAFMTSAQQEGREEGHIGVVILHTQRRGEEGQGRGALEHSTRGNRLGADAVGFKPTK